MFLTGYPREACDGAWQSCRKGHWRSSGSLRGVHSALQPLPWPEQLPVWSQARCHLRRRGTAGTCAIVIAIVPALSRVFHESHSSDRASRSAGPYVVQYVLQLCSLNISRQRRRPLAAVAEILQEVNPAAFHQAQMVLQRKRLVKKREKALARRTVVL
jgi:hypothetical protein